MYILWLLLFISNQLLNRNIWTRCALTAQARAGWGAECVYGFWLGLACYQRTCCVHSPGLSPCPACCRDPDQAGWSLVESPPEIIGRNYKWWYSYRQPYVCIIYLNTFDLPWWCVWWSPYPGPWLGPASSHLAASCRSHTAPGGVEGRADCGLEHKHTVQVN